MLDTRPYSNVELIFGRFLGVFFPAWLPVLLMTIFMQSIGLIAETFSWPIGETLEPRSTVTFVVLMSIPAFALTISVMFVLSLLVRNRFLSAILALALLALVVFVTMQVPLYLIPVVDVTGGFNAIASELIPRFLSGPVLWQRIGMLIGSLGLLVLAAVIHPRLDGGSRTVRTAIGAGLAAAGLVVVGAVMFQAQGSKARFERWQQVHEARAGESLPDIESIAGEVVVDPGRSLEMELELRLKAPPGSGLESALFTLNPGLTVERVSSGGADLSYEQESGLLEVELGRRLAPGQGMSVALTIGGRPDLTFAYLDSARNLATEKVFDSQLALLGTEAAIFDRRYVALMPGIRWLPAAGSEHGRNDPRQQPTDFFTTDLTFVLPDGWLAAGPGRRQDAGGAEKRRRFRFAPEAPLPEVALVASRFDSRSTEIEGITFEVLLHAKHGRNLELFEEAGGEIGDWVRERLIDAEQLGLPYPYDALTLVEVPNPLRGYGGGWQMDTVQAPPGMLMLKETGFPTSRFDFPFRNREDFKDRDGGIARAKRQALERFFENDFGGGNVFLGATRNFFAYQTAAYGDEGLPLAFLSNDLSNLLVTGKRGYFSPFLFSRSMGTVIGGTLQSFLGGGGQGSVVDALIRAATDQPEVWNQTLGVSLTDMDPWQDPGRSINVLVLKGGAMSRWLVDGLGREKTGALLAELRRRHAGSSFTMSDVEVAAEAVGADLQGLLGTWLHETDLPGFVASDARRFRLPDDDNGAPRYQLLVHLHNGEAVPGLAAIEYSVDEPGPRAGWQRSEPVQVLGGETVEVGVLTSKPVQQVRVAPYLALNRSEFRVGLSNIDEDQIVDTEPHSGARPSEWRDPDRDQIVVDDLDPGFRIEEEDGGSGLRLAGSGPDTAMDQGLPAHVSFAGPPRVWSRQTFDTAWGRYRRTVAFVRAGKGSRAIFGTELPSAGRWRLQLHIPPIDAASRRRTGGFDPTARAGTYNLTIADSSGSQDVTFDAAGHEDGWNDLGEYEVASGEVRVELSNESDGRMVVADAIRWQPVRSRAAGSEEQPGG